jgi:hypothetical protein
MKKRAVTIGRRNKLAAISTSTLGDIKGVIEGAGLYTPEVRLS